MTKSKIEHLILRKINENNNNNNNNRTPDINKAKVECLIF